MGSLTLLVNFALEVLWYIVIAHALLSWLIGMQVLNSQSPIVGQIWYSLNRLLDPIYSKIRQFLPKTGMLDFSPLVLIFGIYFIRVIIANNF